MRDTVAELVAAAQDVVDECGAEVDMECDECGATNWADMPTIAKLRDALLTHERLQLAKEKNECSAP